MVKAMQSKGFVRLVLRGLLGGALGGLLWASVAVLASGFRQGWWYWLLLGYLYQGLPLGIIMGAIVGTILWLVGRLKRLNLGVISRFLTGSFVATMIAWITAWWSTEQGDFFPTPWHFDFLWMVFFGAATGGIAGIVAGTGPSKEMLSANEAMLKHPQTEQK